MTAAFTPTRAGLAVLSGAFLILAACEKEVILPGQREDIRPAQVENALAPEAENQTRALRLPAASANADWPQSFGTPAYRTAHPALSAAPARLWSVDIGDGDARRQRITATPVVGGGLIYTLDSSAQVSAVTPSGQLAWSIDLTPPQDSSGEATGGGLAYDNGRIYVSVGFGILAALDARTGATLWSQKLAATGNGTPLVRDGLVYLVAGDNTGWAIHADSGRIAWQVEGTPSVAHVLGGPAPVVTNDLAVFAFGSGDLLATFRKGGLQRWVANVSGQRKGRAAALIGDITGAPVVVGNTLYAGNHSGRSVAIDMNSGERLWTARDGALGPMWPAGDSLFMVTDLARLARIDAADGSTIWSVPLPGYVKDKPRKRAEVVAHYGPILAGGRVIVASNDGLMRLFAPESGALVGQVEVPGGATTAPVVAGGTLYVVGAKGQLHAFR